jgi:hypothetical protein
VVSRAKQSSNIESRIPKGSKQRAKRKNNSPYPWAKGAGLVGFLWYRGQGERCKLLWGPGLKILQFFDFVFWGGARFIDEN